MPDRLGDGIEVRDLSFGYEPGVPVLRGASFRFAAGRSYAIVGASGSGKSTLLRLLMGSYRDYDGSIRYDGMEVRDIRLESLYTHASLVRQDNFLFDATLRDNVTMFGSADEASLDDAIRRAGLSSFVGEHGLDYPCGEGGSALSGGERQRVCIARSLLRGSDVLLLDEATSALDQATADLVTQSVLGLSGVTRIVVTHRLEGSQLAQFDGIVVLRDGKVFESGTFDELMARGGYFHGPYTVGRQ